jgi:hypothetical protein
VDPALAVYQVENKVLDPEPCISFGGKRPKPASSPQQEPAVAAPELPPRKLKKPKKGHPLILKVRPPVVDDSRRESEAGSEFSELSLRPVSRLPLWVRAQRKRQEDAKKQTRCWEKQLVSAERHPSAQVHKKGSRTTL